MSDLTYREQDPESGQNQYTWRGEARGRGSDSSTTFFSLLPRLMTVYVDE